MVKMTVKIVTDSCCALSPELRDKYHIHVVPLSVMIDDIVYQDDDNLSGEKFMEMMEQSPNLPKTSQPPIGEFAELYDELGKDGSSVISIHMTSALSGTVEAARQATHLTSTNVTVIDSDFVDQALDFQVEQAAKMAEAGAEVDEILKAIEVIREHTKLYIGIATLDNLVKGGRVGRAKGALSSFLNMRIILELKPHELVPVTKGRGNKTFMKWFESLKEELAKLPDVKRIGIAHADAKELAEEMKAGLKTIFPEMDILVRQTNPVIATHTGKGAFAIMYYTA